MNLTKTLKNYSRLSMTLSSVHRCPSVRNLEGGGTCAKILVNIDTKK